MEKKTDNNWSARRVVTKHSQKKARRPENDRCTLYRANCCRVPLFGFFLGRVMHLAWTLKRTRDNTLRTNFLQNIPAQCHSWSKQSNVCVFLKYHASTVKIVLRIYHVVSSQSSETKVPDANTEAAASSYCLPRDCVYSWTFVRADIIDTVLKSLPFVMGVRQWTRMVALVG